jgi:hypothetical protein
VRKFFTGDVESGIATGTGWRYQGFIDKAYRLVVGEQSYAKGRNPVIAPLDQEVWRAVPKNTVTGVVEPVQ